MKSKKILLILCCFGLILLIVKNVEAEDYNFTLKEYLQEVVKKHPQQEGNIQEVKESTAAYREQKFRYSSPIMDMGYNYNKNQFSSGPMAVLGSDSKNSAYSIGVTKQFPYTGTMLNMKWNNNWQHYDSIGIMSPSERIHDNYNSFEFTYNQPILQGGPVYLQGKKQLDISKDSVRLSRLIYNSKTEGVIFSTLSLYWQIQLNKKQLELSRASVKDSLDMLERGKRRQKLGAVDMDEVYDFEASYIRTKMDYENSLKDYENLKKEFLYTIGIKNYQNTNVELDLKDEIDVAVIDMNYDNICSNAMRSRKDIEQAKLQLKLAKLALDIAKGNQLPKLDFFWTASLNAQEEGWSKTISKIGNDKVNQTLGFQFQMPLDLRAFSVITEKAKAGYKKAKSNLEAVRRDALRQMDESIRAIDYYQRAVEAYSKTVKLMEMKLEEYKKKYNSGKINSSLYVRAQDDLRMWQKTHLGTLFQYKLAEAQLDMGCGNFLKKWGIKELRPEDKVK